MRKNSQIVSGVTGVRQLCVAALRWSPTSKTSNPILTLILFHRSSEFVVHSLTISSALTEHNLRLSQWHRPQVRTYPYFQIEFLIIAQYYIETICFTLQGQNLASFYTRMQSVLRGGREGCALRQMQKVHLRTPQGKPPRVSVLPQGPF